MVGGHHIVTGVDHPGIFLDRQALVTILVVDYPAFALANYTGAKFPACQFVAPILEGPFRELHDIALMDNGHGLAFMFKRILDCSPDQAFGTIPGDRLDADGGRFGKADFANPHILDQELLDPFTIRCAIHPLDADIDIFTVLTENNHINIFRFLDR